MPTTVQTVNNRLLEKEFLDCPDVTQKKFRHIVIYQALISSPESSASSYPMCLIPVRADNAHRTCAHPISQTKRCQEIEKLDENVELNCGLPGIIHICITCLLPQ